jgi:predicted HicB family RNase H-like nuclease
MPYDQLNIRIPAGLKERATKAAQESGMRLTEWFAEAIETKLSGCKECARKDTENAH